MNTLRTVAPLLNALGLRYAMCNHGPAPIHVRGRAGTPLAFLDVYVALDDVAVFAREIRAHAVVRPLWDVWLTGPTAEPLAWTWGFQESRRQLLPKSGVFLPSGHLCLEDVCASSDAQLQAARTLGMLAYLRELANAELALSPVDTALQNAAD